MGGLFGIASKEDCITDLFFGTDYHSHLGTRRGGLTAFEGGHINRYIHDISNAQFRSKFEEDVKKMRGRLGIGVISDFEDQPLIVGSHLGVYAIATVGVIKNADHLVSHAFQKRTHFSEMSGGEINPTELIATLINQEASFEDGIEHALRAIEGSCSLLLLTDHGIYAGRDQLGRTPLVIGSRSDAYAITSETCAFPNLGFETERFLGPGEVVLVKENGVEPKKSPGKRMQICSFLWVYYGYPASSYEGINVEATRYRCGAELARNDSVKVDCVAGIPDSGVAHAIGYANAAGVPYERPFVKYTPTWPRSFMPTDQRVRDLVARMKLIPVRDLIQGKRLLFAEDSIVRGTQLQDTIRRLFDCGAREVHMRPACPPLIFGCKFLNFSRSRSALDLAGRKAVKELEGRGDAHLDQYSNPSSQKYCAMVERIRARLQLTSLQYQKLDDLVKAIGLPKEKLCTYCWDGAE
jgi:amidophosphoribosyltransferase